MMLTQCIYNAYGMFSKDDRRMEVYNTRSLTYLEEGNDSFSVSHRHWDARHLCETSEGSRDMKRLKEVAARGVIVELILREFTESDFGVRARRNLEK